MVISAEGVTLLIFSASCLSSPSRAEAACHTGSASGNQPRLSITHTEIQIHQHFLPGRVVGLPADVLKQLSLRDEALFRPCIKFFDRFYFRRVVRGNADGPIRNAARKLAQRLPLRANFCQRIPPGGWGECQRIEPPVDVNERLGANLRTIRTRRNERGGENSILKSIPDEAV